MDHGLEVPDSKPGLTKLAVTLHEAMKHDVVDVLVTVLTARSANIGTITTPFELTGLSW